MFNNDSHLNDAIHIYRTSRELGLSHQEAKSRVKQAMPDWYETMNSDRSLSGKWANLLRPFTDAEAKDNGTESPQPTNGKYSPTEDMVAYIEYVDPQVGDSITLNLHYFQFKHGKPNDAGWRLAFSDSLPRRGWKFEVLNTSGKCFTVRVVERPAPKNVTYSQDEIKAMIAAEARRLLDQWLKGNQAPLLV